MPKKDEELKTPSEDSAGQTESTPRRRRRRTADDILKELATENIVPPTSAEDLAPSEASTPAKTPARPRRTPRKSAPKVTESSPAPATEPVSKTPLFGRSRSEPAPIEPSEPLVAEPVKPKQEKVSKKPAPQARTSRTRRTGDVKEAPEPESAAQVEAPAVEELKPVFRRRPSAPPAPVDDDQGRVVIVEWRSQSVVRTPKKPTKEIVREAEDSNPEESKLAPRRSRTRRHKDRENIEITAAAAIPEPEIEEVVTPPIEAPKAEPQPPRREPIERGENAAQVAFHRQHPCIIKDRRVISPLFFYADARLQSQRPIVLEELKEAAEQGIEVFSFLVDVVVDRDLAGKSLQFCEDILSQVREVAPQILVVPRISFKPASDWTTRFPNAVYQTLHRDIADPSVSDDEYWAEAEASLIQLIEGLCQSEHADRILGVHFDQEEWFLADDEGYDISAAAVEKFRNWLKVRYRKDIVSLRASWFDGSAKFDEIDIPDYREGLGGEEFVRTDRRARRWIDYHLFCSDETVDRIGDLCYAAKKASNGDYLVGASYGFTFEWSHPFSGHLSLGKLLRCPDLDYASGPPSYRDRSPGGTAAFPFPVDSFALNGKLFMSEDDFRTPISGREEQQAHNPVMKTPQALESAHWRGIGGALAHEGGAIWMDTNGGGWLNSPGIWQRGRTVHNLLLRSLAAEPRSPDVAFFVDERSLTYLTDPRAFEILVQQSREAMLRSGLSVGFYLLSDLAHRENFPESKLYVFVNAWDIRPEVRSAIKSRLQRDGKLLFWLYTAGLFEAGRDSLERVREVTGIALRPQPFNCRAGTTLINTREELSTQLRQDELITGGQLEPSYFAIPEDGQILGEYTDTGLPSFVRRHFEGEKSGEDWTSVFLGEPIVTPGLLRVLGQQAGAHVWSFENDLVHANPPFVTVHCSGSGPRSLMLPDKWAAYHLEDRQYIPVENNAVKFRAVDGSTHTFLVGTMGDIEAILNADIEELATVREPIVRPENTLHWDKVNFDVQVMKLDEWVEESWSEEHADDLLLKPSMFETEGLEDSVLDETDSDDQDGRRRTGRRRSRRRRPTGRDRKPEADQEFGETGVSIVFRKRE